MYKAGIRYWLTAIVLVLVQVVVAVAARAEITMDGTLGQAGALAGPDYAITADLGQQVGSNLFQSFGLFNVNTGESATFSGPASISNIVGRVTGGGVSMIDGQIASSIPNANLFLINPAGMIFGENARLDVQGSFHASSADYVSLSDGGRFDADTPANSLLTSALPSAFGFLDGNAGSLSVQGSRLRVPVREALSLVGGDLEIRAGPTREADILAPAGQVNLVATASAGEVDFPGGEPDVSSFTALGTVDIRENAVVRVDGINAGTIYLRGGEFTMDSSTLDAETAGNGTGGGIDIMVTGAMTVGNASRIRARTFGAGNAGDIIIDTGTFTLSGGSQVTANVQNGASGDGGFIQVDASGAVTLSGTDSFGTRSGLYTNTIGSGEGGFLAVNTPALAVTDGARIEAVTSGTGTGGLILLNVGTLSILDGGRLNLDVLGSGNGGSLVVDATQSLTVRGTEADGSLGGIFSNTQASGTGGDMTITTPTMILDDSVLVRARAFADGDGGSITLNVGTLSVTDGSQFSVTANGSGAGGDIAINATGMVTLDGRSPVGFPAGIFVNANGSGAAGFLQIVASTLLMDNNALIQGRSTADGVGGSVILQVGMTTLDNSSKIDISTTNAGAAGDLTVSGASLTIDNDSEITASSQGSGAGGAIQISLTDTLTLQNGGTLTAGTESTGLGGFIDINAGQAVNIIGRSPATGDISGIFSNVEDTGNGGFTSITAPSVTIDDAIIQAVTSWDGNAGDIEINATNLTLINGGEINASTVGFTGYGNGGNIDINVTGTLTITGTDLFAFRSGLYNVTRSWGDGGTINISAGTLDMDNLGVIQASSSDLGDAGAVNINVVDLFMQGLASIESDAKDFGNGGQVTITATGSVVMTGTGSSATGILSHFPDETGIYSDAELFGNSGSILINAPLLTLDGGARIQANTEFDGDAGFIQLNVGTLNLTNGGRISSNTTGGFSAFGNGGSILINATQGVFISGFDDFGFLSGIFNSTNGFGDAGDTTITAPVLSLAEEAQIQATTFGFGNGGQLILNVGNLTLTDGGRIDMGSFDFGNAGDLLINATGTVRIDGRSNLGNASGIFIDALFAGAAGTMTLNAGTLTMDDTAFIIADAESDFSFGAGFMQIDVDKLYMNGGSSITANNSGFLFGGFIAVDASEEIVISGSDEFGNRSGIFTNGNDSGEAGFIDITTASLTLADGARIRARSNGSGDAGIILFDVADMTVRGGAQVSTTSSGPGDAGGIRVNATGTVSIEGSSAGGFPSGLFSSATGGGDAGILLVFADTLNLDEGVLVAITLNAGAGGGIGISADTAILTNGARITSQSFGTGDAGLILMNIGSELHLTNGASITTEATFADGGDIEITAQDLVYLFNSDITATVGTGQGNGGNITIDPQFVVLDGQSSIIANAFGGTGGNIDITADYYFQSPNSVVSASSRFGLQGTVAIDSPDVDLTGTLALLAGNFLDVTTLLTSPCAARTVANASSFVVAGRGGVPAAPDTPAPGAYVLVTPVAADNRAADRGPVADAQPAPQGLLLANRAWQCGASVTM